MTPKRRWSNLEIVQSEGMGQPVFGVHCDEANEFLPKYWGQARPYYAFRHQGRGGKRVKLDRVEDIAVHFIRELKEARPEGPYLFCGYSFGGLIAYEMARQLRAEGHSVPFLALIESYAPVVHAESLRTDMPVHYRAKRAAMRTLVKPFLHGDRKIPSRLHHFHIIETYERAVAAYKPKPYQGQLIVLKAEEAWGPDDLGWQGFAHGGLETVVVPGDHHSAITEPHVEVLAALLHERIIVAEQRIT